MWYNRICLRHLEFIWKLRKWAFEKLPKVDPRAIVEATILDDAGFLEYIKQFCVRFYRASNDLKSDDEAEKQFAMIACMKHSKAIKKKWPTADDNDVHALSLLKVLYGALNHMSLDSFKLALFNGNPAEDYFATIETRLKDAGIDFEAFDSCSKIPDTLDPDKKDDADANEKEELQQNADG